MFQRTPYRQIVAATLDRLRSNGVTSAWVGIKGPIEMWLGDYLVALKPGAASVDEGTTTGTGACGSVIRRPIAMTIMTRSYEDEAERAEMALYDHLDREESLLALLHLWMPTDPEGILLEPMRLASVSEPTQEQGIIKTVLTFEATYAAIAVPQIYEEFSCLITGPSGDFMLWGDGVSDRINWQ